MDESGDFYSLFPYIEARQLERGELTDIEIASMGRMLGRIHLAGKDASLQVEKEGFKPWDETAFRKAAQSYLEHIAQILEPTGYDQLAKENLELKLSLVGEDMRQYQEFDLAKDHFIHGDYLHHNLFFDKKGEVSHVFDLEKSQYASRSYELIRSLLYSIMDPDMTDESLRRARLYLSAYQEMYPINLDEIEKGMEIFFLKSIRGLWMEKELYTLNNRRPEQFLGHEIARTNFLSVNRHDLIAILMS